MDSTWRQNNGVNPLHLKAIDDLTTKWFCNKEPENVKCHAQKFDDDDDGCLSDDNSHPQEKFKDKVDAPTEPQISRSSNDHYNLPRKEIKANGHAFSSQDLDTKESFNVFKEYTEYSQNTVIDITGAPQNVKHSYNLREDINPKGTHDVHKDDEHSKLQSKNEVKGRSAAPDNEAQQSRWSIIETVVPLDVNLETISGNPFRNQLVEQIGDPLRSVLCNLSTVADDPLNHGREGLVHTEPVSSKSSKTSKKKRRKVPLKPKLKEHQTEDGYKQKLGLDCDPKFVQETASRNHGDKTFSAENECYVSPYYGTKVGHLEIEHKVHRYSGFTGTRLGSSTAFPVTVTLVANAHTSSLELLDGRFKAEQYRYASFEPIQSRLTPPPSRLAKNGLFYDREANTIACFCCGISLREEEWESLRSPETRHLQLVEHNNFTCHFIRGDECGNIPWGTSSAGPATSPTDQQSSNTEILVSSENWNGAGQNGHSGNEESDSHGTLYTDSEILPQSSNNHLPAEQQQQPRAEFSHSGVVNGSNVVAAVAVSSPENNLTEVVKASGTAVFESSLANLTSSGQFQPQIQTIQVYHSTTAISASFRPSTASAQVRYPVQVEQDPQGTPNQPSNRSGQLNDHDEAPGLDMRRAVSPGNALVAVRIATFASWPGRNLPQPRVLVLAGFYYMGIGDSVRCFYCGVTLKNWRANDDVWETHVRFRFSCDYVHFIKGEEFVCRTLIKLANGGRIPAESGFAALPSTQSATNGSCTPAVSTNVSEQTNNATNGGYPNGEHGSTQVSAQAQSQVAAARDTTRPGNEAREVITVGNSATRDATTAGNSPAREATGTRLPSSSGVQAGGRSSAAAGNRANVTNTQVPEDRVDSASHVGRVGARGASNGCTARGQNGDLQMDVEGSASTPAPTQRAATVTGQQQPQVGAQQAATNGTQPVAVSSTRPSSVSTERPQPPRGISNGNSSSISGRTEDVSSHLQELSETNRRLRQQRTCRLCGQRSVDTIFLPCGHLCTCEVCAATIRDCCLCRDRIRGTAHVFLE